MLLSCHARRASLFVQQCVRPLVPTKSLCGVVSNPSTENESNVAIKNVTVITTPLDAANAIKTLLDFGQDKYVAWSAQIPKTRRDGFQGYTMSAYAGEDVDFGNGPYLFIPAELGSSHTNKVWDMFTKYFEDGKCSKVWLDYQASLSQLNALSVKPKGLMGEIVNMSKLIPIHLDRAGVDEFGEKLLKKAQLRKAKRLIVENGLETESNPRQWERDGKPSGIVWNDAAWIVPACADARVIHTLFEELRIKLKSMEVHGINCTLDFSSEMTNLYEVYRYFFPSLLENMHGVEQRGVGLKTDSIQTTRSWHEQRIHTLKSRFLQWATTFCPDASLMDVNSSTQLKHLLFAPCSNVRKKSSKWPEEKTFKVKVPEEKQELAAKSARRKARRTANIRIRGRGAVAKKFSPAGWPSTTTDALRKAAGFPRASPPDYGQEDKDFCHAVDDLLTAKELEARGLGHLDYLESFIDTNNRARMPYLIDEKTGRLSCSIVGDEGAQFLREEQCSNTGNSLLVGQYKDLELSLLAQMSECESLRERIEASANTQELGAYYLFENVKDAVDTGECVFSSSELQSVKSIAEVFPEEHHRAVLLDENMAQGGNLKALRQELKLKGPAGKKIQKQWFKHHPEVKSWIDKSIQFAEMNGFVETLLGRRRLCSNLHVKNKAALQNSRSSALRYILSASAGEAMMAAIRKLGDDETLEALGWQVVFLDRKRIVLEGPSYATDEALPIVARKLSAPTDFPLDLLLDVSISAGSSITSIEMDKQNSLGASSGKKSLESVEL